MSACNTTADEAVCGGVGQCSVVDGVAACVCPEEYAVLYDCERTHYSVEPEMALVIGIMTLIAFAMATLLFLYDFIWSFIRRPKTRWSLLQVFKLVSLFFVITRVWAGIHLVVNSQIGHDHLWGALVRQATVNSGTFAMFVALGMVVSLWFAMAVAIHNIDTAASPSVSYVKWGLTISGVIVFVVGTAGGIYNVFLRTTAVVFTYAALGALYSFVIIGIAIVALAKSRKFWWSSGSRKTSASSEFARKAKIMIGWVCVSAIYVLFAVFVSFGNFTSSNTYFVNFAVYAVLELALAALSLAFNQHYLYPFRGFACLGAGMSTETRDRKSRESSVFSISTQKGDSVSTLRMSSGGDDEVENGSLTSELSVSGPHATRASGDVVIGISVRNGEGKTSTPSTDGTSCSSASTSTSHAVSSSPSSSSGDLTQSISVSSPDFT